MHVILCGILNWVAGSEQARAADMHKQEAATMMTMMKWNSLRGPHSGGEACGS